QIALTNLGPGGTIRSQAVSKQDNFWAVISTSTLNTNVILSYTNPLSVTWVFNFLVGAFVGQNVTWADTIIQANVSTTNNTFLYPYICDNNAPSPDSIVVANAVADTPDNTTIYLLSRNLSDNTSAFSFSSAEIASFQFPNTIAGPHLLGKMLVTGVINSVSQEIILGAPSDGTFGITNGTSGGLGSLMQFQFSNFCKPFISPPPFTPPPPIYYVTLTRPPAPIGVSFTEFALAVASTSDAAGIAAVGRQNDTNLAVITIYERISPGGYKILDPPLSLGPSLLHLTSAGPQTIATVRLADDFSRWVIASSDPMQPVMFFFWDP